MKIVFEWSDDTDRNYWEAEAARLDELFSAWLDAPSERTFQLPPGVTMKLLDEPATTLASPVNWGPGMLDPSIVGGGGGHDLPFAVLGADEPD